MAGLCGERDGVFEGAEELGIFGGAADGDADGFGKTHPGERADNDAFVEKFVAESLRGRADGDEEEVGLAFDGRENNFLLAIEETLALAAVDLNGALDVFGIVKSG